MDLRLDSYPRDLSFNPREAFELAELVEKKTADFYIRAADDSPNESSAKVFLGLADVEFQHAQVFLACKDMLPAAGGGLRGGTRFWPIICQTLLSGIDTELSRLFEGKHTPEDIMKAAMSFERDSIVFFMAMAQMIPAGEARNKVERIAREEMGHLISIAGQMSKL